MSISDRMALAGKVALCAAVYVSAAGCRHAGPLEAPLPIQPCPAPVMDTAAWQVMDRGAFVFRLPTEFHQVPVQGIDSWVEEYRTPDSQRRVSLDYGWYSNDLHRDPERHPQYASCAEVIGGRQALVIVARLRHPSSSSQDGSYAAAATWRDVRPGIHLTVWTETRDPSQLPQLLALLRTVHFPGPR